MCRDRERQHCGIGVSRRFQYRFGQFLDEQRHAIGLRDNSRQEFAREHPVRDHLAASTSECLRFSRLSAIRLAPGRPTHGAVNSARKLWPAGIGSSRKRFDQQVQ